MAWEMQEQMFQYLEPSIHNAIKRGVVDLDELTAELGLEGLTHDVKVRTLAERAQEYRTTENGANRFYLLDPEVGGNQPLIEWCSEDDMLEWWG